MNKNKMLKIVNPLLAFSLVTQGSTGYLLEKSHALKEIHEVNAVIILTLAALHLFLNWAWVKTTYFKKISH